jgi:hypothetical protein
MSNEVLVKTVKSPVYSNCVGDRKYKAYKVHGGYQVTSNIFGLFIDERDVASTVRCS